MASASLRRFRFPVSSLLAILTALTMLLTPFLSVSTGAQGSFPGCDDPVSIDPGSIPRGDAWTYDSESTLTNGTVIGYQSYWTEEPNSTPDAFHATTGDQVFMAGDYPAGTPLETIWADLCPVLAGMGTITETGPAKGGGLYALMLLPTDDGAQQYGVVHLFHGYQSDIPLFAILIAQADALYFPMGVFVNGQPAFGEMDSDEILATLQGGSTAAQDPGTTGGTATGEQATLGSGTVVTWADPWGDPIIEANSVNLATADDTVFSVDAYPSTEHTVESAAALTPAGDYTVYDSGPDSNGGFFQLSGLAFFDPLSGEDRVFFAYSRAWPSADGQWTIATRLESMTPFFTRDLASIPASITLDGAPLWADVDPAAIVATLEAAGLDMSAEQPPATGGQATTPTGGTQETDEFTTVNGTVFAYTAEWSVDPSMDEPDGIQLLAGNAIMVLGDLAEDQDSEALFNQLASSLPQIVDQGPTPDGGYYGLAYGQDNAGQDVYLFFRYLYAADTETPVLVVLVAPTDEFADSLALAHDVTANGQPVLQGVDDDVLLATYENGGPTGEAVFSGGQASDPLPTDTPATTVNEVTGPSGTLFAWGDDWTYESMEGVPASVVILYGVEVPASVMMAEGEPGQSVDAFWESYSSTGGEILDERQSPDGGYYEISFTDTTSSPVGSSGPGYTLTRVYATETAPILVSVMINGEDFDASLQAARGVTTNGISILEGVDDAALIAVFENGGPTGESIFTDGQSTTPTEESGRDGGSDDSSIRDIIRNVPGRPGSGEDPEPTPEEGGASSSYTSDMFGYTIAWEESWAPYEDATEVNEEEGYDIFALQAEGRNTGGFSIFAAEWDEDYDAGDYIDYWASDDFVQENFVEGTEVVLVDSRRNSGAVVFVGPLDEEDPELWVTVYEVVNLDDEVRIEPTLIAPLSDFEDVYDDATRSITLNGDEFFGYFTIDEIMDELPAD